MKSVTVRLMGGLANQMFQYAAGLSLARRHGAELILNTYSYRSAPPDRQYQLDIFSVPERVDHGPAPSDRTPKWYSRSTVGRTMMGKAAKFGMGTNIYREPAFYFDPGFFDIEQPCELRGYFHSARYFEGSEHLLRARFSAVPPLSSVAAAWTARLTAAERSVAVHVRGGDYKLQTGSQPLRPLDRTYYAVTLDMMAKLIGDDASVFVFTDDPAHARAVLPSRSDYIFVEAPAERPWEDLHLMSLCRHIILANSSFSWWAAWLNQNPTKVAIAPRQWFTIEALREKNVCDLFPQGWLLV